MSELLWEKQSRLQTKMIKKNSSPSMPSSSCQQRARIVHLAAKLMAEDGIRDYSVAKRKAAISLGFSTENACLPENAEIESELRLYQRLFQGGEQAERLDCLRRKAVEFLELLQPFNPYLAGSVLDGTAGRHAEIDIQLFIDSTKELEIFLLNRHVIYQHQEPRSERAEAVLAIPHEGVIINLIVYPHHEERVSFKTRDGKIRPRARVDAVKVLLAAQEKNL